MPVSRILSGGGLENFGGLPLHVGDVEIGNGAGVERDGLAGRDDVDQGEGAAAGAGLGDGMGKKVIEVGEVGRHQNLVGYGKETLAGHNMLEGFHGEKPPVGESAAGTFVPL